MSRLRFICSMIFDGRGAPVAPSALPEPHLWRDTAITGSCLGHSTVLLNFFGVRVLTDPVFSDRAGPGMPLFILGPKRHLAPALQPAQILSPDVILISHAHFDHLDTCSLSKFPRTTPIVTARATGDIIRRLGFRQVHELDWDQSLTLETIRGTVRLTALTVAHWGARFVRDVHRGFNGYLIERAGHTVCFAGDTAYTETFAQLNQPLRPLDLMLMPIGAYEPWIRAHCNPEQAAAMARAAGALAFVPIHHGTFKLSNEAMDEPARRIRAAFSDEPHRLLCVQVGETFRVPLRTVPTPIERLS